MTVNNATVSATLAITDPDTQVLLGSGRWVEVLVPLGSGDRHMIVGAFYGVSGASMDTSKRRENERLLSYAVRRLKQFQHTPYVLAGDFNIDPLDSEVIALAIDQQELVDVFASRTDDIQAIHPTYAKNGVYEGMAGPGKTRIDAVLCNPLANSLVADAGLRWGLGMKFDHACLAVQFNLAAMTQKVQRLMPVAPIDTDSFFFNPTSNATKAHRELCDELANRDFKSHWKWYEETFANALRLKNIDEAHRIWCSAAEVWLLLNQCDDPDLKSLSSSKVARRGHVIPLVTQDLVQGVRCTKDAKLMGFDQ